MADITTKHQPLAPGDIPIKFKDLGDGTYAQYLALEPASIGSGGGGGTASSVSLTDGVNATLKATVSAALALKVDGSAVTQPVSGTFWQTTQPVSGPLTDTQLRALAVPVSGTFFQATQPVSIAASLAVTGPLTDTQLRATAVPVSGSFFQATQPVSLATNTPDVTDRAARLLGHVTVDNASIPVTGPLTDTQLRALAVPVSGTFFQGTQPVSIAATLPVSGTFFQATQPISAVSLPLPTGAALDATLTGKGQFTRVTDGTTDAVVANTGDGDITRAGLVVDARVKMWNGTSFDRLHGKAASVVALATDQSLVVQQAPMRGDASNLCVTTTAATGVAATLTLPAAAAGLFHYITLIEIQLYATAARTGGATPVLVTTTNLPGSPAWDFDTAQAIGNTIRQTTQPTTPIKSSVAATATTIVAPIAVTGIWRITAYYYTAP